MLASVNKLLNMFSLAVPLYFRVILGTGELLSNSIHTYHFFVGCGRQYTPVSVAGVLCSFGQFSEEVMSLF